MTEYYNLTSSKLNFAGINQLPLKKPAENFEGLTIEGITSMSSTLPPKNAKPDKTDTIVSNPNGYGYIASLNEVKNQDALDIQTQQSNLFTLGAITGVSMIVFGILVTSYSNK
jgi:hypothetical protein